MRFKLSSVCLLATSVVFGQAHSAFSIPGIAVTPLPPYVQIGSATYIPTDYMYQATLPSFGSWVYMSTQTCTSSPKTNGNMFLVNTNNGTGCFLKSGLTTSIEVVFSAITDPAALAAGASAYLAGIYFYDGTNVWTAYGTNGTALSLRKYTCTGACAVPTFSATVTYGFLAQTFHLRGVVAGGTLTFSASIDGGITYTTVQTQSVGTISSMGLVNTNTDANFMSVVAN